MGIENLAINKIKTSMAKDYKFWRVSREKGKIELTDKQRFESN